MSNSVWQIFCSPTWASRVSASIGGSRLPHEPRCPLNGPRLHPGASRAPAQAPPLARPLHSPPPAPQEPPPLPATGLGASEPRTGGRARPSPEDGRGSGQGRCQAFTVTCNRVTTPAFSCAMPPVTGRRALQGPPPLQGLAETGRASGEPSIRGPRPWLERGSGFLRTLPAAPTPVFPRG